jgi:hypothetical protein
MAEGGDSESVFYNEVGSNTRRRAGKIISICSEVRGPKKVKFCTKRAYK